MKSTVKTMSKIAVVTLVAACSFGASASSLDEFDGTTCARKKQAIETQIDYAKKNNNTYRVQDKTNEVAEREQELAEAKAKGDVKKIAKQEAKLQEDKAELSAAKTKLAEFYKDLNAN